MQRYILTQEQQQQGNAGAGQGAQETDLLAGGELVGAVRAGAVQQQTDVTDINAIPAQVVSTIGAAGIGGVTAAGNGGSVAQVLCVWLCVCVLAICSMHVLT